MFLRESDKFDRVVLFEVAEEGEKLSLEVSEKRRIVSVKKSAWMFVVFIFFLTGSQVCLGGMYRVGPGDVLRITVYDNDDLKTIVRVTEKGDIIMPLIGMVDVSKKTISQISDVLTQRLSDGFIVNPQVNVFIEEFRNKKVIILGAVKEPGLFELSGSISFLELLSKAGGLTKEAGNSATIKRIENGKSEVILIDLISLIKKGDLSQNPQLVDDDTIYITKSGNCYVTGQVKTAGAYPCDKSSTVLKLIALAGGFSGKASQSNVKVVRKVGKKNVVMKQVNLDMTVEVDDVVIVPESFF